MLVLLLSTAQAHESDPQYFFLDDSADLLGSAELDSDWLPKDGLLAVRFQVDAEPLQLGIDQAVPYGLALNELITNAFKYGAPAAREHGGPDVIVSLREEDGLAFLAVRDHGPGIGRPLEEVIRTSSSLGLRVVSALAKQLGGSLGYSRDMESCFVLTFPVPQPAADASGMGARACTSPAAAQHKDALERDEKERAE